MGHESDGQFHFVQRAADAIERMKTCGYSQVMKAEGTRIYILCLHSELGVCDLTKEGCRLMQSGCSSMYFFLTVFFFFKVIFEGCLTLK